MPLFRAAIVFCCCSALFVLGCRPSPQAPAGGEEEQGLRTAIAAVEQFHKEWNGANTQAICRSAAPEAFRSATELPCPEYFAALHQKLGAFRAARRPQLPIVAQKPLRVGMEYISDYEKGEAREHFEYRIHGGQATLTSYRIASDALTRP